MGSVLSVQTMGTSSAAQLLGGLAQNNGNRPRSNSSKKAFESKSLVGEAKPTQRRSGSVQRAGGSVLSVKNPSSSAAAGLLGPLLELHLGRVLSRIKFLHINSFLCGL